MLSSDSHPVPQTICCVSQTSGHKRFAEWCKKSLVTSMWDTFILSSFLLLHAPDQQQTGSAIGKGTHLNDREHQEGGEIYPQHNLVKTFGEHAGQHACWNTGRESVCRKMYQETVNVSTFPKIWVWGHALTHRYSGHREEKWWPISK